MKRNPLTSSSAEIDAAASDWIVRRDAGLTVVERETFARWQAADPRHAEAVARHDQAWALLDRPRSAGRADEMAGALAARASRRRRRRLQGVAAAMMLVTMAAVAWQIRRPDASRVTSSASAVVLLPQRQTLPDGSVVDLRAGAEISVDYSGVLRRVTLQKGEAHFEVAKDLDRPFVVTAAGLALRAVGTAFLVQLGGSEVELIVTEGRVGLENREGLINGSPAAAQASGAQAFVALVEAGNRLTVDLASAAAATAPQPAAISAAEIAGRLAWRAPRLEFSDAPLAEAVALINQHARVRLVIDDPVLAKMRVNGLFRADNTEALLHLLEASFGVKADRAGNTITLRRAP